MLTVNLDLTDYETSFSYKGRISAVVFNGNCCSAEEEKMRDSTVSLVFPKKASSPSIYRGLKEDAVRGGCILSAAELDSSKEYLQQPGGSWVLAYQVYASLHTSLCLTIHFIFMGMAADLPGARNVCFCFVQYHQRYYLFLQISE